MLDKILRVGEGRIVKKLSGLADQVNALEETYQQYSDEDLRAETDVFRERIAEGETLDELLPEAFAVVREAAVRTLGQRHFDVQIMGGAALHMGNIAEMGTGEGKTLVATLPAYLNAIAGKGVHVVTVNDYLASYQSELMGRIYRFLGLSIGCIVSGQKPDVRREQYAADITYGTNNEFGFDYLRDNMAWSMKELVQREHNFAIVDEVDSILIDEARTPLIISGPADGDVNKWYTEFAKFAKRLKVGEDYEVDEKKRTVGVLESGIEKVEDYLGIDNLYESLHTPLIGFLNNAIRAKELYKKDKDYVVLKGEVLIVDEHTGRMLPGRRYNEGMHQAIEAKENVKIKAENQTLATVTLQNYFRLYERLSGMTGTAETEAAEFQSTYKIGVVPIPPNKPRARADQGDLIYQKAEAKFDAVVADIVERHAAGQPVLVGTTSVEKSEYLSAKLRKSGVPHEVLNAKNHAREAAIVAQAGRKGAVTVATNMAGRGTDIMLGGNVEYIAADILAGKKLNPTDTPEEYEAAWPEAMEQAQREVSAEHDEVADLGGLYVLGTERHESRRIDNQLRGRSGRQGDPGESRFYLSMEDDLMRLFNSRLAESMMTRAGIPDDVPIEAKIVTRGIQSAQSQVEARNFETRKNVLKYDDVLSRQRELIYDQRRRVLEGEDMQSQVEHFLVDVLTDVVTAASDAGDYTEESLETLWVNLKQLYPISVTIDDLVEHVGSLSRLTPDILAAEIISDAQLRYADREEELGTEPLRELERRVVLSVLDRKWREHLYEMDYLKEGIGLRSMAQRDPLIEYQREGAQLFDAMTAGIKEDTLRYLFNLEVKVKQPEEQASTSDDESNESSETDSDSETPELVAEGLGRPQRKTPLQYSAPSSDSGGTVGQTPQPRVVRQGASGARQPVRGSRPAAGGGAGAAAGGNREARRKAQKAARKKR